MDGFKKKENLQKLTKKSKKKKKKDYIKWRKRCKKKKKGFSNCTSVRYNEASIQN